MARLALAYCMLAAAACAPAPSTTNAGSSPQPSAEPVPLVELRWCDTAGCFVEAAARAQSSGALDVWAAQLGHAYALAPSDAAFEAWLEALAASGQQRALAEALAGARAEGRHAELVDARQAQQQPAVDASVIAGPASETIAAGLRAELDGELDRAITGLSGATEPMELAQLGDMLEAQDEQRAAREARSRARVELDERGASMRLAPIERWRAWGIAWMGEHLLFAHGWRGTTFTPQLSATELRYSTVEDPPELLRSLVLPGELGSMEVSIDGRWLYGLSGAGLEIYELPTGRRAGILPASVERAGPIVSTGAGDAVHLLIVASNTTQLWTIDGELVDSFSISGTTPTIIRAYTGEGSYHHNILNDSPSWPVSIAVSEDLRHVAVGGSDSKVRLFDRQSDTTRMLEYDWEYVERRHGGGNPDLNLPLDLRFVGDELLAIYAHGDLIRWRLDGAPAHHDPGTCSHEDLVRLANRYTPPGQPEQAPSDALRESCSRAQAARFSPDGRLVVTVGLGDAATRVRDTSTGQSLETILDSKLPADQLAWSADGRLAFSNYYGRAWIWSRTEGLSAPWGDERAETGPLSARLSADGRLLQWQRQHTNWVVWDLHARTSFSPALDAGESVQAMSMDGSRFAVSSGLTLELRRRDGSVERREDGGRTRVEYLDARGRFAVLRTYDGPQRVIDLDRDRPLTPTLEDNVGNGQYAVSSSGARVVRIGEKVEIFDGERAKLLGSYGLGDIRAVAISPTGEWVAWLEQLEQPEGELPHSIVHLLTLDDAGGAGRKSAQRILGWANQLIPSPDGTQLLVATENRLARWRVAEDVWEPIAGIEYVIANSIRYTSDGQHLLFEAYDQIQVRANEGELPVLATIYPRLDGGWMAMSAAGAVDGSSGAQRLLATVVEGPRDGFIDEGSLGWDRFVVPGLVPLTFAGREVLPPMPAAPQPAR